MAPIVLHTAGPTAITGYGTQAGVIARAIAGAGHDVVISAFNLSGRSTWEGIEVYGTRARRISLFGQPLLRELAARHRAELVLTFNDCWVYDPDFMRALSKDHRVAHIMPVDCQPLSAKDANFLEDAGTQPVAISRFGQQVLARAGHDAPLWPHSVDTAVFKPGDRAAARAALGLPQDAFIILVVAANASPERKGWRDMLPAFAAFHSAVPESLLLAHTDPVSYSGLPLHLMNKWLGTGPAVIYPPQDRYQNGEISAAEMADTYNAADVFLLASRGEGFGLPVAEAQACGLPVIVTECSALSEVAAPGPDGAWRMHGELLWSDLHSAGWMRVPQHVIVRALASAYNELRDPARRAAMAAAARQHVLDNFDSAVVSKTIVPGVIESLVS